MIIKELDTLNIELNYILKIPENFIKRLTISFTRNLKLKEI